MSKRNKWIRKRKQKEIIILYKFSNHQQQLNQNKSFWKIKSRKGDEIKLQLYIIDFVSMSNVLIVALNWRLKYVQNISIKQKQQMHIGNRNRREKKEQRTSILKLTSNFRQTIHKWCSLLNGHIITTTVNDK